MLELSDKVLKTDIITTLYEIKINTLNKWKDRKSQPKNRNYKKKKRKKKSFKLKKILLNILGGLYSRIKMIK